MPWYVTIRFFLFKKDEWIYGPLNQSLHRSSSINLLVSFGGSLILADFILGTVVGGLVVVSRVVLTGAVVVGGEVVVV